MTEIVFIGEAWGEAEAQTTHPFVGSAGQELARMLNTASFPCPSLPYKFTSKWTMIDYWGKTPITLLNTFNSRPPNNEVELYYASLASGESVDRSLPMRRFGSSHKYVLTEHAHHVRQLHETLNELRPNLIVPLGNTALWALGLPAAISKQRGTVAQCKFGKLLPTYHPAAVLRNWSLRHITIADLFKAKRESKSPDISITNREIAIPETVADLYSWWNTHTPCDLLALDIETIRKTQISEVGIAVSPTQALWIPIVLESKGTSNIKQYQRVWSLEDEILVWKFIKEVSESAYPKIGQNLKYDIFWLSQKMNIRVRNYAEDTMLKAHAWQPEMQKSLGFLASLFLDETSWKSIRKDAKPGEAQ